MAIDLLFYLIGGLIIAALGFALIPKQATPKPPELSDFENPTSEAGRPVPIVFGGIRVTGTNILYYGQKNIQKREVEAEGGGK